MHLIQILLPRRSGEPATTAGSPPRAQDEMLMVEVLAPDFDCEWWRAYAETLAARFEEQEIHVRALPAEIP
ncbi:MAG: hypothetical protein M3Q55_09520 [Acidobacteriota bacterium]|nr:hypothetical protein [Acidobacteriota bacterium]